MIFLGAQASIYSIDLIPLGTISKSRNFTYPNATILYLQRKSEMISASLLGYGVKE
jgi:hypothetical protein